MSKAVSKSKESREPDTTIDVRILKALGHPLRQRVLQVLNRGIASPSQIAQEIEEPLSNVSYHVKILESCDAIELVKTEPVRGALEHFYRATMGAALEQEQWALLPESAKNDLAGEALRQIGRHASEAAASGGFEDPKSIVSWINFKLDDEAYAKLSEEALRLVDFATDLEAEAAVRLARLDDEACKEAERRLELATLLFHRA